MGRGLLGEWTGLFASRILGTACGFLSMVATARLLDREGYGAMTLLTMCAVVPSLFLLSWSNTGFLRFAVEEYHRDGRIGESFGARALLFLGGGAVLAAVLSVGRPWVLSQVQVPEEVYGWILPFALSYSLAEAASYWLQSVGRVRTAGWVDAARVAVESLGVGLAWAGWIPATLPAVLGLQVGTRVAAVAVAWGLMPRGALLPLRIPAGRVREITRYGWSLIPGSAAFVAILWVDVYVLQRMLPLADVGVFQVARQGRDALLLALTITLSATVPMCMRLRTAGDLRALEAYRDRLVPFASWVWSVALGAALLAAPVLVTLFGDAYREALPPLRILLLGVLVNALYVLHYPLLAAFDRMGWAVLLNAWMAALCLPLVWWGASERGLQGAAWGYAVAATVGSAPVLLLVRRLPGLGPMRGVLSQVLPLLPGLAAGLLVLVPALRVPAWAGLSILAAGALATCPNGGWRALREMGA